MPSLFRRFLPFGVLYIGVRVLLLLTRFDDYALPAYEMSPVGIIGAVASGGWRGVPLAAYYDNCGGHLLWGLASAPFFRLFGPSYMVLKIVPLLLGLIDLWLIWDLARRVFGGRAAQVSALAFVFAVPTLLSYSMLAKGNHFEGLTFPLLATWLWFKGNRDGQGSPWLWLSAVCAGFSVFVYTGAALWVGLLALAQIVTRGWPSVARATLCAAAFLLGLAPLIWIDSQTGRAQEFLLANLPSSPALERTEHLVCNVLLESPGFAAGLDGEYTWLGVLWWLVYMSVWVALASMVVKSLADTRAGTLSLRGLESTALLIPLLLYLPVFCLAFALSNFRFEPYSGAVAVGQYRYLVPHFGFACLLLGAGAQWASKHEARWLARAVPVLPVGLGLLGLLTALRFDPSTFSNGFQYRGFDHADLARHMLWDGEVSPMGTRVVWDFDRIRAELDDFELDQQQRIAFGLGRDLVMAQALESSIQPLAVESILSELPAHLRGFAARGAGAAAAREMRFANSLRGTLEQLLLTDRESAECLAAGLSSPARGELSRTSAGTLGLSDSLRNQIPDELRVSWRRGQGELCGALLGRGLVSDRLLVQEFLNNIPAAGRDALWSGAEQAWMRSRRRHEVFGAERTTYEQPAVSTPVGSYSSDD